MSILWPKQPARRAELPEFWRATARLFREHPSPGEVGRMTPEQAYAAALENAALDLTDCEDT